ncbi:MAG TPA: hypothetical protein H9672_02735 [Firmicutes bacterium]|nr:hypothetical protein [Bacillota bacterium]
MDGSIEESIVRQNLGQRSGQTGMDRIRQRRARQGPAIQGQTRTGADEWQDLRREF